jgi:enterochelin esterase family protein
MALSQILIDGENWKRVEGVAAVFRPPEPMRVTGVEKPICQVRSPDGETLFVGSAQGKYVWAFRVEKDGSFTAGQPYCSLRVPRGEKDMPVAELSVDNAGRIYAATPLGVQIFDPTGRLSGVLSKPSREPVLLVNLLGDKLYVATEHGVYERKVKARAIETK